MRRENKLLYIMDEKMEQAIIVDEEREQAIIILYTEAVIDNMHSEEQLFQVV